MTHTALTELLEQQRQCAFGRYQALRPHLEQDVPLARVAADASMPLRTAQRWVSRYQRFGWPGLTRAGRTDQGKRRVLSAELCRFAEGLALQRPAIWSRCDLSGSVPRCPRKRPGPARVSHCLQYHPGHPRRYEDPRRRWRENGLSQHIRSGPPPGGRAPEPNLAG